MFPEKIVMRQGGEVPRLRLPASLHLQPHLGCSSASLILRRLGHSDYLGKGFQVFPEGRAQDAHAGAVDDAHAEESGEECAVNELLDLGHPPSYEKRSERIWSVM